jgi:hypothetical protein
MKAKQELESVTWSESVFFEAGGTCCQQSSGERKSKSVWGRGKKTTAGGHVITINVMPAHLGRAVAELDGKNKLKIVFYHWSGGQA